MTRFDCDECEKEFDVPKYFWDFIGKNVTCPHCGTEWETEADYSDSTGDAWYAMLTNKV